MHCEINKTLEVGLRDGSSNVILMRLSVESGLFTRGVQHDVFLLQFCQSHGFCIRKTKHSNHISKYHSIIFMEKSRIAIAQSTQIEAC